LHYDKYVKSKDKGNPYSIQALGLKLIPVKGSQPTDDIVMNLVVG